MSADSAGYYMHAEAMFGFDLHGLGNILIILHHARNCAVMVIE
ncbi:MAG: hypothetical protein ABR523_10135 [Desulfurivibrionaceae bacterium]